MSDPNTLFRVGDRVVRRGSGALATVRALRALAPNACDRLRVMWDDGDDNPTWQPALAFDLVPGPSVAAGCGGEDVEGPPVLRRAG